MKYLWVPALLVALPALLPGQAILENAAVGTIRRNMNNVDPSAKAAKSIGKAFETTGRALQKQVEGTPAAAPKNAAVAPAQTATGAQAAPVAAPPPKPAITYEDPAGIAQGMDTTELLRRFGPPALQLSGSGEDTYCYESKTAALDVIVRNGKVAVITKR